MHNVLIEFPHGLGDAVQFTAVLRHLREFRPDWVVDFAAFRGKHTAAEGLCRNVIELDNGVDHSEYDDVYRLSWPEPEAVRFPDHPATKVEKCLREVFKITPRIDLCGYELKPFPDQFERAAQWFESHGIPCVDGVYQAGLLHYEGNTSTDAKNLNHDQAIAACAAFERCGLRPVVFDWDRRSPLPDGITILNPDADDPVWGGIGTGDALQIAAFVALSAIVVAIDSGPGKVAGAAIESPTGRQTPVIAVWRKHIPLHYHGPAKHVTHLVHRGHELMIRGSERLGITANGRCGYRMVEYRRLIESLYDQIHSELNRTTPREFIPICGVQCRREYLEPDAEVVRDIVHEDAYNLKINPHIWDGPLNVVDVGGHIGSFAVAVKRLCPDATIVSIEANPKNAEMCRVNVDGGISTVLNAACAGSDVPRQLLDCVHPATESPGGSELVPLGEEPSITSKFTSTPLEVAAVTLDQVMDRFGFDHIDVLKLDCEGSEFEILENAPLHRINWIFGEFHENHAAGRRWADVIERMTATGFVYSQQSKIENGIGVFHMKNKRFENVARV